MKNGGYQILELNCKDVIPIYDNYGELDRTEEIISLEQTDDVKLYIKNLTKNYKTLLLKNLLLTQDTYINIFINYSKDKIIYYVIDTSNSKGYTAIENGGDSYYVFKLNDDYVLLIDYAGKGLITKLYKGAITQ